MPVRFIFGVHNHQPVGNFHSVFAQAHAEAYEPFLELMAEFPDLPFVVHVSGCLLEWLESHRPSYLRLLRDLVSRGQVELLGGAFYEPILTLLPRRDRLAQIRQYTEHLEGMFGCRVRGLWLAERVWEPCLAADLAEAGMEYTLLDDFHFRQAGVDSEALHQCFLTEDAGQLLRVFPISEPLRYLIPWKTPGEAVSYLEELGQQRPGALAVCADDGEKFGAWPGTHALCYKKGWLRQFLVHLRQAVKSGKVQMQTLAQACDAAAQSPLVHLPDCSYREMTEWALPTGKQRELRDLMESLQTLPEQKKNALRGFLRGGTWRAFRAKYPEIQEMYARMIEVSQRVEAARQAGHGRWQAARRELHRAQCNCSYWHGAFGGLYLPHLRHAVFSHLLAAENLLEPATGIAQADFNLDGRQEIKLSTPELAVYVAPHQGGMIYELDSLPHRLNLQSSLARRPEPYHDTIRASASDQAAANSVSLVEASTPFKQPGLEKLLHYDALPRKSLLAHAWPADVTLDQVQSGTAAEFGAFSGIEWEVAQPAGEAVLELRGADVIAGKRCRLTKRLEFAAANILCITCRWEEPPAIPISFGLEFMVAGLAAGQADRFFLLNGQQNAGPLESILDLPKVDSVSLLDQWRRLKVTLEIRPHAKLWAWPQQTVSQSEGGFEAVHQGNLLVPHWRIEPGQATSWEARILWRVETL